MLLFRRNSSPSCLTFAAVLLQFIAVGGQSAARKQPHILFIVADDFGWNDVGYHGSEIHTPTLDGLAADGVKLDSYYVQPICSPTRSQLLTGRYQIHLGLQHGVIRPAQPNGVPLDVPTIADTLKATGYSTHIVGKWHIGFYKKEYMPTYRGFDSFYGYLLGSEQYYTHKRCYDIHEGGRHQKLCGVDLHENDKPVLNESGIYSTQLFTARAERIVKEHAKSRSNKPLFLYLPLQAVHAPLEVPSEYTHKYDFISDKARRIYAGMVSCMDEAVANITKTFKDFGLWDNTVLIFSTDNGGQVKEGGNNWPLRGWKGSLWEGGVRGVGFVNSPLLEKNSTTSRELMHVSDWFPTLMYLAGANTTGLKLDGHNVWRTISKGEPSPRKELLHNIDPLEWPSGSPLPGSGFDTRVRAAMRVGRWKLITGNPGPGTWVPPPPHNRDTTLYFKQAEHTHVDNTLRFIPRHEEKRADTQNVWLFDIMKDPLEKDDVSQKYPSVVRKLLQRLEYYNSTAVPVRYPRNDPNADPARHGGVWQPWED